MDGDNTKFALGTDTYTIADGFLTTMLTFCTIDTDLWRRVTFSRPCLNAYFERMKNRPSYREASISVLKPPGNCMTGLALSLFLIILMTINTFIVIGIYILIFYLYGFKMVTC